MNIKQRVMASLGKRIGAMHAKASETMASVQHEARGELRERTHVIAFLMSRGHHDLAGAIAREEHWRDDVDDTAQLQLPIDDVCAACPHPLARHTNAGCVECACVVRDPIAFECSRCGFRCSNPHHAKSHDECTGNGHHNVAVYGEGKCS